MIVDSLRPLRRHRTIKSKHPIQWAGWEEKGNVDRSRASKCFQGWPVDLHSIRVNEDGRTDPLPVGPCAQRQKQIVRVTSQNVDPTFGELPPELRQRRNVPFRLLNQYVSVERRFDGERNPDRALLDQSDIRLVIAKK